MTDEKRKLLTAYLGENIEGYMPRTFDNPADFFALRDKAVEKGDWDKFLMFVTHKIWEEEADYFRCVCLGKKINKDKPVACGYAITDKIKMPLLFAEWCVKL